MHQIFTKRIEIPLWLTSGFAAAFVIAWSLVFWFLFFVQLSWGLLKIPMGLAGAIYPVFFLIPVSIMSVIYQLVISRFFKARVSTRGRIMLWRFAVPCVITSLVLMVFCPMDGQGLYLSYLWQMILSY